MVGLIRERAARQLCQLLSGTLGLGQTFPGILEIMGPGREAVRRDAVKSAMMIKTITQHLYKYGMNVRRNASLFYWVFERWTTNVCQLTTARASLSCRRFFPSFTIIPSIHKDFFHHPGRNAASSLIEWRCYCSSGRRNAKVDVIVQFCNSLIEWRVRIWYFRHGQPKIAFLCVFGQGLWEYKRRW